MSIQECEMKVTMLDMSAYQFRFRLEDSPAFEYGNGTCVIVEQEGCQDRMLDTRYVNVPRDEEGFAMWCSEWLRDNYQVLMAQRTVNLYERSES